jgi:putative PIN family toxin of toxin-antitoxin system
MNNSIFVLDTNILISAILPSSTAFQALERARTRGKIAQSLATLEELKTVLERPKFDRYVTIEERRRFLAALVRDAHIVDITISITDFRDTKDNKFLELAVCAQAQYIISGDNDLLIMNPYREISILSPRTFLDLP